MNNRHNPHILGNTYLAASLGVRAIDAYQKHLENEDKLAKIKAGTDKVLREHRESLQQYYDNEAARKRSLESRLNPAKTNYKEALKIKETLQDLSLTYNFLSKIQRDVEEGLRNAEAFHFQIETYIQGYINGVDEFYTIVRAFAYLRRHLAFSDQSISEWFSDNNSELYILSSHSVICDNVKLVCDAKLSRTSILRLLAVLWKNPPNEPSIIITHEQYTQLSTLPIHDVELLCRFATGLPSAFTFTDQTVREIKALTELQTSAFQALHHHGLTLARAAQLPFESNDQIKIAKLLAQQHDKTLEEHLTRTFSIDVSILPLLENGMRITTWDKFNPYQKNALLRLYSCGLRYDHFPKNAQQWFNSENHVVALEKTLKSYKFKFREPKSAFVQLINLRPSHMTLIKKGCDPFLVIKGLNEFQISACETLYLENKVDDVMVLFSNNPWFNDDAHIRIMRKLRDFSFLECFDLLKNINTETVHFLDQLDQQAPNLSNEKFYMMLRYYGSHPANQSVRHLNAFVQTVTFFNEQPCLTYNISRSVAKTAAVFEDENQTQIDAIVRAHGVPENSQQLDEILLSRLQKYIDRIRLSEIGANTSHDVNMNGFKINFCFGFLFFIQRQAINREANFRTAIALRDEVASGKSITQIFTQENIDSIRGKFKHTLGIHSSELNGIIAFARSAERGYRITTKK